MLRLRGCAVPSQQPAKASVLVHIKPGRKLAPQNIVAINHLVASAVEGLSPDAVSVLDIVRLQREARYDVDLLRRAGAVEALPQGWRDTFLERLANFS